MQPFIFSNQHVVSLNVLNRPTDYCPLKIHLKAGSLTLPAIIDTGAFTSAISLKLFNLLKEHSPQSLNLSSQSQIIVFALPLMIP